MHPYNLGIIGGNEQIYLWDETLRPADVRTAITEHSSWYESVTYKKGFKPEDKVPYGHDLVTNLPLNTSLGFSVVSVYSIDRAASAKTIRIRHLGQWSPHSDTWISVDFDYALPYVTGSIKSGISYPSEK